RRGGQPGGAPPGGRGSAGRPAAAGGHRGRDRHAGRRRRGVSRGLSRTRIRAARRTGGGGYAGDGARGGGEPRRLTRASQGRVAGRSRSVPVTLPWHEEE